MSRFKNTMIVAAALLTAVSVAAAPAYAGDDATPEIKVEKSEKTETEKSEKAEAAEKAKLACTADELAAFIAAEKAEAIAKAKRKASEQAAEKKAGAKTDKHLKAPGTPEEAEDSEAHEAEKAAKREAAEKAEAAHKAKKAKERAAEEKAHAAKMAAKHCAYAKQEAAHRAKKEADRKARARKFQAIGVVAVTDGTAGTVTVFIKAGSPDLHKRKLAIKVTAETRIQLDGESVALADLVSGTFVSVHGVRHEGALVAGKINAASPGVEDEVAASPSAAPAA